MSLFTIAKVKSNLSYCQVLPNNTYTSARLGTYRGFIFGHLQISRDALESGWPVNWLLPIADLCAIHRHTCVAEYTDIFTGSDVASHEWLRRRSTASDRLHTACFVSACVYGHRRRTGNLRIRSSDMKTRTSTRRSCLVRRDSAWKGRVERSARPHNCRRSAIYRNAT